VLRKECANNGRPPDDLRRIDRFRRKSFLDGDVDQLQQSNWHRSSLKGGLRLFIGNAERRVPAVPHNASTAVDEHERKWLFISIGATKLLPLPQACFSQSLEYA
jgi:hypothetical protein